MSPGKLAAQAGHAFLNAFLAASTTLQSQYLQDCTKVVLKAKRPHELEEAHRALMALGVPCALVIDQGHVMPPFFTGAPILTALGFGPAYRHQVKAITRKFTSA